MRAHRLSGLLTGVVTLLSAAPALAAAPTFQREWGREGETNGRFDGPWDVALDAEGNVYVTDAGNQRVQKFTADGLFLAAWGTFGDLNGQFNFPLGIAVHGDAVYVLDSWLQRVQKFTTDGTFVKKWGGRGSDPGQFLGPAAITVSEDGKVYVADRNNTRVQRFDENGAFEMIIGSRGNGPGEFSTGPQGVALGPEGDLFVAVDEEIHRFDPDGAFLGKWTLPEGTFGPRGFTIDGDGVIYGTVEGTGMSGVIEYDAGGTLLQEWGAPGAAPGEFDYPVGLAVSAKGEIYVVDRGNNRIQVFLNSATPVRSTTWGALKAGTR